MKIEKDNELYKEEKIIKFYKGMLGFEGLKEFKFFDVEENPNFKLLKSNDEQHIGFVVVSPFDVNENYEVNLKKSTIKALKIEKEEDVLLFTTVTLNKDIKKITTNLRAPIVINIKTLLGEQLILDKEEYKIKTPLIRGE